MVYAASKSPHDSPRESAAQSSPQHSPRESAGQCSPQNSQRGDMGQHGEVKPLSPRRPLMPACRSPHNSPIPKPAS